RLRTWTSVIDWPASASATEGPHDPIEDLRGGVLETEGPERLTLDVEPVRLDELDHVGQVLEVARGPGASERVELEREQVLERGDADALGSEVDLAGLRDDAREGWVVYQQEVHGPVRGRRRGELDEGGVLVEDVVAEPEQQLQPDGAVPVAHE